MSEAISRDNEGHAASIDREVGTQIPQREGILLLGVSLSFASIVAAFVSLQDESNLWFQFAPLTTIAVLSMAGLYLQSRRIANLHREIKMQVSLSITVYFVVWVAACGFSLASIVGPSIGSLRTSLLYATSFGILLAFASLLVRAGAVESENRYCLGLATSTLLAGALLPLLNPHYSYSLAHCFMAFGYAMAAGIQLAQQRKANSVGVAN